MFEEMCEARSPLRLGPETDVVDDRDRGERGGAVGRHENAQPVPEGGAFEVSKRSSSFHGHEDSMASPRRGRVPGASGLG